MTADGSDGWDDYARYYDWENARTIGARDVAFWQRLVSASPGPVIELGCGSGRVLIPVAKKTTSGFVFTGGRRKRNPRSCHLIGVDRSAPMLDIARRRAKRLRPAGRPVLIRGDIRALPIASASAALVMAPYGILQSLVRDVDLARALAEAARVLQSGGQFVVDLVPDLPRWTPYRGRVRLRGRGRPGTTVTLVESVRQDRRRGLTIFDEEFVERSVGRPNGRKATSTTRRFSLSFRTLPLAETRRRLVRAGFRIEAMLGGYRGEPWTAQSGTWLIAARKR
ncbi:MAG TPA: class I SAM-dependent methyltransferase [Vicinamibacterales bacterium]|nr:class I SAM-dependent methyltransferase [Vicinamibacterales bacterium]